MIVPEPKVSPSLYVFAILQASERGTRYSDEQKQFPLFTKDYLAVAKIKHYSMHPFI